MGTDPYQVPIPFNEYRLRVATAPAVVVIHLAAPRWQVPGHLPGLRRVGDIGETHARVEVCRCDDVRL